jgi:hypothetical protein
MPQSEVLGQECGPRAKEGDEGPQKESNQAGHAARIRAENESKGAGPENAKPQSAEAPMRHSEALGTSGEAPCPRVPRLARDSRAGETDVSLRSYFGSNVRGSLVTLSMTAA